MIIPKKKETAMIILSKLKKDGGSKEAEVKNEEKMGEGSPIKIIASDMMMAFKNGSVADLESALEALAGHIQSEDEEQDAEAQGMEPGEE